MRFDGGAPLRAASRLPRGDTAATCGNGGANGYLLQFNFNLLGDGPHSVSVRQGGTQFASSTFEVTTFGQTFLRGATGTYIYLAQLPCHRPERDGGVGSGCPELRHRRPRLGSVAAAPAPAAVLPDQRADPGPDAGLQESPLYLPVRRGAGGAQLDRTRPVRKARSQDLAAARPAQLEDVLQEALLALSGSIGAEQSRVRGDVEAVQRALRAMNLEVD